MELQRQGWYMNYSSFIIGVSEARLWQGWGQTNGDQENQKKSQKGQFLFTGLSWIKIYIREKIIFKMQALRCCFFLLPQPQCLKKNCWERTSQKPQTAGAATKAAKAEHNATRFWQDFLTLVLLSCLLWISFPLLLPQPHSATAPLHGFPHST